MPSFKLCPIHRIITSDLDSVEGGRPIVNGLLSNRLNIFGNVIVNPGGAVVPGDSPGTLTINGDFTLDEGDQLIIEINGTNPGEIDLVEVFGDANIEGLVTFDFSVAPSIGDTVDFLNITGALTGNTEFLFAGLVPGFEFETSFDGTTFTMTALTDGELGETIPEPGAIVLMLCGLLAVLSSARRCGF